MVNVPAPIGQLEEEQIVACRWRALSTFAGAIWPVIGLTARRFGPMYDDDIPRNDADWHLKPADGARASSRLGRNWPAPALRAQDGEGWSHGPAANLVSHSACTQGTRV